MSIPDEEDFTTFSNYPACSIVQTLNYNERCSYVKSTPECREKMVYFNYIHLLYCGFDPRSEVTQVLGVMTLLSLCLVMFLILGTTADKFFCPALKVLSKMLGMNEHLAGVTLLAFGNGSPDLFTSLASINDPSRLLFSDLLGAGIYVISLVGGIICIIHPFKLQANNVLRDVCFFLFGILFIDYAIISDNHVTIAESVDTFVLSFAGILSIYFIYLIIILLDQFFLKRYIKDLEKRVAKRRFATEDNKQKLDQMRSEASIDVLSRTSRISIDVDLTRQMSYNAIDSANNYLWVQFFQSVNPVDAEEWHNRHFMKVIIILKIPINFVLQLCMPIVDYELQRHGWSKLLNCLQIIILPAGTFTVIFSKFRWGGVPISVFTLLATVPISLYVLLTTRTDLPPRYHYLFAIYSAFGSIFIIYSCASETVQILYVLGIVTYSSNSFLGCTLLAWGNGIGDLVSNIALSQQGYEKMGFAACYGGPFFNSLLSMGGSFLYKAIASDDGFVTINQGPLGENCLVFILIVLFSTMVWTITTDFYVRRCIGIFNIIIYMLFFTYAILGETEVIQTYAPETVTGFT